MINTTKDAELLGCPFCGAKAVAGNAEGTKFKPFVQCSSCYADMVGISQEDAIKSWNTRAAPPAGRLEANDLAEWQRLLDVANNLISETSDPGTEALAAVYCSERRLSALKANPHA